MSVVQEILNQLGGRKFLVMTGAKVYSDGPNTLVAKFPGSKVANLMHITLNSMDLYDVKFSKYRGMNLKVVKEVENIYNDQLKGMFERTTFLAASL